MYSWSKYKNIKGAIYVVVHGWDMGNFSNIHGQSIGLALDSVYYTVVMTNAIVNRWLVLGT